MLRRLLLVLFLTGVFGLRQLTVFAGSGTIPTFNLDAQLNGSISVTCPGSVGFTWRVGVDGTSDIHVEQTTSGGSFRLDGSRIGNGHHNAVAQVRCAGEPNDWSQATSATKGFDWFGGNPTPAPPPPGFEVAISLSVSPTTVSPGTIVGTTTIASCSNTTVRAIRIMVNSVEMNQLGSNVMTWQWTAGSPGTYIFQAQAACNGDDSWKTVPNAQVTVTVQQGATSSGGNSSTGTAGDPVSPPSSTGGGANASVRLGTNGLDVQAYCQQRGQNESNDGVNAWSWGCGGTPLNHSQVCREVWGDSRPYAWLQGGLAGWTCEPTPQPNTGTGGNQSTGSGSPSLGDTVAQVGFTSAPSGQWVKVVTGMLNVRSGAGTNHAVVAKAPYGRYFSYITTTNGWHNVSWNGGSGWVAGASQYTVRGNGLDTVSNQPAQPVANPPVSAPQSSCGVAPTPRLAIGGQGRNTYGGGPTRVRTAPRGAEVYTMAEGETFDVLEGPVCRESGTDDNLNWWRIRVHSNGKEGWAPEGGLNGYWLEPWTTEVEAPVEPGPGGAFPPGRFLVRSCNLDPYAYDLLTDPAGLLSYMDPIPASKYAAVIKLILIDYLGLTVDIIQQFKDSPATEVIRNVWDVGTPNKYWIEVIRFNDGIEISRAGEFLDVTDPRVLECGHDVA